jgi:DNA-binding transcriptional MerR regulator
MKNVYRTAEVAKLFNIPVATLHYWESEGLFTVRRDPKNGYRYFDMSDVLNIWEIVLYRELDIPIRDILQIMDSSKLENLEAVYREHRRRVQERISQLQRIQRRMLWQQEAVREVKRLSRAGIMESRPDFELFARDSLQIDTMLESLFHSYDCGLISGPHGEWIRTHRIEPGSSRKAVWTVGPPQQRYAEFLLKVNLENMEDNNLEKIREELSGRGLKTGGLAARFLLVLGERGKRYEYYRAWLEIGEVEL